MEADGIDGMRVEEEKILQTKRECVGGGVVV